MAVANDHGAVRPEPPKTYYDGVVKIPGYELPPDRCQGMKPVGFCHEGHVVLGRSSCGCRYCPDHWRDWIEDAVVSMVSRLAAYRQAQPDGPERRLVHAVASPPQDRRYSADAMWRTRSESYGALEAVGAKGGAVMVHPYRTNDRGEALFASAVEAGAVEDGTGRWRFLRDASEGWGDLSRYVEAAPHYHALAPAESFEGEAAPDGWVVKRIRSLQPFHLRNSEAYEDMAKVAYYVLTHAAASQDGRHSTTYFGAVHPASFNPEEELTAAEWDRIQLEAEKAVRPPGEGEGEGGGPDECPREECDALVRDLLYLSEYLRDEEWCERIRAHRDGGERLAQLRGALAFWEDMVDRPPPSAQVSEEHYLEWLKAKGQVRAPTSITRPTKQVGLKTAVM